MPAVSVLLPVRDAGPYLAASLASLWRQTLDDFEVIAVNDGSTDGSGEVLERASRREPRLRVIHLPASGLPAALNAGLQAARGRWIARHDADDVSRRRRLQLQRAYLATHSRVGVVGSRLRIVPSSSAWVGMRRWAEWHNTLLTHEEMIRELLVDSPLAHGTTMFRRAVLERAGGWAERGWPEDVDLWLRLTAAGVRLAKLPQTLYAWRQHPGSATRRQERYSQERFDDLRMNALRGGLLAQARRVTVVGVGRGIRRWSARLAHEGFSTRRASDGQPTPAVLSRLEAPGIFVFGAPVARARWRDALVRQGWEEGVDFVFVV
jgi:GT2 family glycosyltransferase